METFLYVKGIIVSVQPKLMVFLLFFYLLKYIFFSNSPTCFKYVFFTPKIRDKLFVAHFLDTQKHATTYLCIHAHTYTYSIPLAIPAPGGAQLPPLFPPCIFYIFICILVYFLNYFLQLYAINNSTYMYKYICKYNMYTRMYVCGECMFVYF